MTVCFSKCLLWLLLATDHFLCVCYQKTHPLTRKHSSRMHISPALVTTTSVSTGGGGRYPGPCRGRGIHVKFINGNGHMGTPTPEQNDRQL